MNSDEHIAYFIEKNVNTLFAILFNGDFEILLCAPVRY